MDELIKKENLTKKRNIIVISIVSTLVILMGSVYAFFTYSKSADAFTLTSNSISVTFTSANNNVISFTNAYPISDEFALENINKLDYIDFTVSGSASNENEAITYEIFLTQDTEGLESNQILDARYIKTYVTDNDGNQITEPTKMGDLPTTTYTNEPTGKIVIKKTYAGSFEKSYRLYIWLDEDYTQNEVSQNFSFYVNIYAYNDIRENSIVDVSFDANGGTVTPTQASANYGSTLTLPTPERVGYNFDGWYTASTGGTEVTNSTTWTSPQTIYAHWDLDEVTINSFTIESDSILVKEITRTILDKTGTAAQIEYSSYSSNNTTVATVDSNGVVTGVSGGEATITVTLTDYEGNESIETVDVTVVPLSAANVSYDPPEGITCKDENENETNCDNVQLMIEKINEMLK